MTDVNVENFNKLIDFIKSRPPEAVVMGTWVKEDESGTLCGTAGCVAGNIRLLQAFELLGDQPLIFVDGVRSSEGQHTPGVLIPSKRPNHMEFFKLSDDRAAGKWLGIDDTYDLFRMYGSSICGGMFIYDEKLTPDERKAAMIRVLEVVRDTGTVAGAWGTALEETLGRERFRELFKPYHNFED